MNNRLKRLVRSCSDVAFRYNRQFGLKILTIAISLLMLSVDMAYAKEYRVLKNARGGYKVQATIDRYPLFLGDNHLEIEIRDSAGKRVTNADVLVNYYMPPMPRMVPMNYKTKASPDDEIYEAEMNIIMAGPWYIRVIIKHEGKVSTAKFNVDAQ